MALLSFDTAGAVIELVLRSNSHNQVDEFTHRQSLVQRILATSSSCASITLCLAGMYTFLAIDPRRLIFRHQLIFFLLFFDLLKAVILLLYPTRVLTHSTAYYNDRFCQVVGFFTATAIEGADIAILAFAIHTYLLIFKPQFNTKVKNSTRIEGGLYRYRNYVYGLSFLIPLVLASLAFISSKGYTSLVCWCYLPERPVWYRLVLSWVPRWCIIVIIFTIYALIYFHVIREFKTLGGVFTTFHKNQQPLYPKPSNTEQPSFYSALKYFLDRITPKWIIPDQEAIAKSRSRAHQNSSSTTGTVVAPKKPKDENEDEDSDLSSTPVHVDTENIVYDPEFHAANLEKFRKRQRIIEKQMKSIFIYPFAYCFVWLFPFILYVTQINYEEKHHPIYWMNCMGAFMQPFNGFVDTLVFFHREQPWKYTIMKNFEKEHMTKMDNLIFQGYGGQGPHGSVGHKDHDSESIATSARLTKNSLSASTGLIDIKEYPAWRKWLSWLRLPLFILPTDESATKFQTTYINTKLNSVNELSPTQKGALNLASRNQLNGAGTNNQTILNSSGHDFSNILSGDLAEASFRSNLENFSLNFSGKLINNDTHLNTKRSSVAGGSSRKDSIISSNRSNRSRQISTVDVTDPVIIEGRKTSYPNTFNNFEMKPMSKRTNSGPVVSSTPKKTASARNSFSGIGSSASAVADDDMDFLEFLRKGP